MMTKEVGIFLFIFPGYDHSITFLYNIYAITYLVVANC